VRYPLLQLRPKLLTIITGLLKISFGEPLPITAARAQGFNIGIVAILDKADTIPIYAAHAAHQPYEYTFP
jgi:hypothetical protein